MSKLLKERRKELGKEVNDIAGVTRIKSAYLRAIEEEEYEKLPVEVYTRGYIREYAEFLGVPSDQALGPYEAYLKEKGVRKDKDLFVDKSLASRLAKEHGDQETSLERQHILEEVLGDRESPPPVPGEQPGRKRGIPRLVWVMLPVIIAVALYTYVSQQGSTPPVQQTVPQAPPPPAAEPAAPAPDEAAPPGSAVAPGPASPASPEGSPGALQQPAPQGTAPGGGQQPAAPAVKSPAGGGSEAPPEKAASPKEKPKEKSELQKKKQTLDIVATDRTWIEIGIDGTEKREVLLNPGDKVSYGANESIALVIGNAAGVRLNFNGKALENLGAPGEVVRLTLPRTAAPGAPSGASGSAGGSAGAGPPPVKKPAEASVPGVQKPKPSPSASASGSPSAAPSEPANQ
ncbi:MAG: RodZ domain-containing protein [Nitrospirota bacterium]